MELGISNGSDIVRRMTIAVVVSFSLILAIMWSPLPTMPSLPSFNFGDDAITIKSCTDQELERGQTYKIPANCVIAGDSDIIRNGKAVQLDNDPVTGLVTFCSYGCRIQTPHGASITAARSPQDVGTQMLLDGCGDATGCSIVYVYTFAFAKDTTNVEVLKLDDFGGTESSQFSYGNDLKDSDDVINKLICLFNFAICP